MRELAAIIAISIVALACFSNGQAQSTLSFTNEGSKPERRISEPQALFTPAGLLNSGLESIEEDQPKRKTIKFDFSWKLDLASNH